MKNNVKKSKVIELSWEDVLGTTKSIPDGYQSVKEICKEVGAGDSAVRRKLARLLEQGLVERLVQSNVTYYKKVDKQ